MRIPKASEMSTKEAIRLLKKSAEQTEDLKESFAFSKQHTKWISDTLYLLEEVFGRKSRIFISFAGLQWQFKGTFVATAEEAEEGKAKRDHWAYLGALDSARGIIESGIDLIKRKGIESVYEGKDTPKEASEILKIVFLIENGLRKAIIKKPTKEKDAQDALEVLFIGAGLGKEYTREKERILYSSKTYQPDFVFKRIDTVVEVKFCDREGRDKEIIGEINDYIVAFQTKYPNLIFVVYDIGIIRDPDEFKASFEQQKSVIVKIIKH
jgi:hypothetical protein